MPRRRLHRLSPLIAALALALTPAAAGATTHHHRRHPRRTHAHRTHARPAQANRATAVAVCSGADTSAVGAPQSTMRAAVVCLINQQRALHHLPPLRANGELDRSAQSWSNTMVRMGQFTHGSDFSSRILDVGYFFANAGENIATGFDTPRRVVDGWMASTDHCQNILSPSFADVGTGVNASPLGSYGPATWTQDFGLVMGHRMPSRNSGPARGCPYTVS